MEKKDDINVVVREDLNGKERGSTGKGGVIVGETRYTEKIKNVTKYDFLDVGGKGANLGEMIAAGLPVPGGFILLTDSYRRFISAASLEEKIEGLLKEVVDEDLQSMESVSEKISELFATAEIPADIIGAIDKAYKEINEPKVAVRSSATAEDLPGTSFAGQYTTFLNVQGRDELLQAIKDCWASLWNYRALSYRVKQGISNVGLAHGVVVQEMINAEKSGILFTANPVNGRRDQMLLNSSWGLGEAIVGGEVTPDQWILDKRVGIVVEEKINNKEVMTIRKDKGIEFVAVPEVKRKEITLDRKEVDCLLDLGNRVEEYFGSPQDIEWAYRDGEFFLVQTRPITSLYPLPEKIEGKGDLRIHTNMSLLSQGMQEPLTTLGAHFFIKSIVAPVKAFKKEVNDEKDIWWCQTVGGRVFMDYTELLRNEKWWEKMIINDYFSDQDPLSAKALLQWLDKNREEITAKKSPIVPFIFKNIFAFVRLFGPMAKAMAYGSISPLKAREKAIREWERLAREAYEGAEKLETVSEKLDYIDEQVNNFVNSSWASLSLIAPSFENVVKAEKMAAPYLDSTEDFRLVEKSLPYNSTTEMGIHMMKIAKSLAERGEEPTMEHEEVRRFFERYGHRSNQEVDIGIPRWDEEPGYVLNLIKSYIDNNSYEQGLENFYRGADLAEKAIRRIYMKLESAGKKRLAVKVERLLRNYREIFGLREESKFCMTRIYHMARRLLIDVGEELKARGMVDDPMDVFFLEYRDLYGNEKLQDKVKANKESYHLHMNLNAPRLLSSTGESIYAVAEEVDGALAGTPVSAGVYEGIARVLSSPNESNRIEKGDVLITRGTNPAWTPLFLNLGAIVMETGGPISHGAVVAREYGVPAVVGIGEVTSLIRDGQKVRVNGETGQVELLD